MKFSTPLTKDPPPVNNIPFWNMSADSSGGVSFNTAAISFTTSSYAGIKTVLISSLDISTHLGIPLTISLPAYLLITTGDSSLKSASSILLLSLVNSPISTLSFFLTSLATSVSTKLPAIRIVRDNTISPKDKTPTSVVPPPISTIITPFDLKISTFAPSAAAFISSSIKTSLIPIFKANSIIISLSILVTSDGQQITLEVFDNSLSVSFSTFFNT